MQHAICTVHQFGVIKMCLDTVDGRYKHEVEKQVLNVSLLNSTGLRQDALTNTMIDVSRTRENC